MAFIFFLVAMFLHGTLAILPLQSPVVFSDGTFTKFRVAKDEVTRFGNDIAARIERNKKVIASIKETNDATIQITAEMAKLPYQGGYLYKTKTLPFDANIVCDALPKPQNSKDLSLLMKYAAANDVNDVLGSVMS